MHPNLNTNNQKSSSNSNSNSKIIFYNGKFKGPGIIHNNITAVLIKNKRFHQFGTDNEILDLKKTDTTQAIDLKGRIVIPGLNDSHIHLIRGGLNFNMELRWDGINKLK